MSVAALRIGSVLAAQVTLENKKALVLLGNSEGSSAFSRAALSSR